MAPAPFEIPTDLHPDVVPLAFLLGRWEGRGHGDYPTIDSFEFGHEVVFSHNGKPYLYYTSRTWLIDAEGTAIRPLAMKTGFWRPQPDGGLELVLAHPTGVAEVYYGKVEGAKIELATDVVARTATAKEYAGGSGSTAWSRAHCCGRSTWRPSASNSSQHLWGRLERAEPAPGSAGTPAPS